VLEDYFSPRRKKKKGMLLELPASVILFNIPPVKKRGGVVDINLISDDEEVCSLCNAFTVYLSTSLRKNRERRVLKSVPRRHKRIMMSTKNLTTIMQKTTLTMVKETIWITSVTVEGVVKKVADFLSLRDSSLMVL
jgi:hypothetical protein